MSGGLLHRLRGGLGASGRRACRPWEEVNVTLCGDVAAFTDHSFDCFDPLRRGVHSPLKPEGPGILTPPILLGLPPNGLTCRVLHLDPIGRPPERWVEFFRFDTMPSRPIYFTGVSEHGRAVGLDALPQAQARRGPSNWTSRI